MDRTHKTVFGCKGCKKELVVFNLGSNHTVAVLCPECYSKGEKCSS